MKKTLLVFFIVLLLVLSACTHSSTPRETEFFAMDTFMSFVVYGDESFLTEGENLIREYESVLSATQPGSPLSLLNKTGTTDNQIIIDLVSRCSEISALTNGYFDITVYPAVYEWGFTTDNHRVLTKEESDELTKLIGYQKITRNEERLTLQPSMMIDFGAVAKGYCTDKLVELLREKNISSAVLNLGGNVYALGRKPNGSKWEIGIKNPLGEKYVGTLEGEDVAVVTSGAYQRYFERGGVKYGHILDPFTARPAESDLASATVIGPNALLCDALSTALFVMGLDKSISFLQNVDVQAVLVTENGEVFLTPGLDGVFRSEGDFKDKTQVISW